MALVMTSGPALEPVTVAEAKAHLRIDNANEDLLISSLILTSRLHIEAALGLALVTQSWKLVMDAWPGLRSINLPLRPLQAVTEVRVIDSDGVVEIMDPADYLIDANAATPRIATKVYAWPQPGQIINGIEIDMRAGYGDLAADVPAPIKQALLLLVAHWYDHRDSVEIGSPEVSIPQSVSRLLKPYAQARL